MSSFSWESLLRQWSQAVLESMNQEQLAQLPQEVITSRWLGYPGATEEQIIQTEIRLGLKLPPSYREFLKVTNGWRQTTQFIHKLWSTEGIERFARRHSKWIEAFVMQSESSNVTFDDHVALEDLWEHHSVTDAEYYVYGEAQDCSKIRVEYLQTAVEISDAGDAAIYLLNPQVVTEDGEWEAWFFGDWLPGADRYRSFYELMETEYHNFLELRDSAAQGEVAIATAPSKNIEHAEFHSIPIAPQGSPVSDCCDEISSSYVEVSSIDIASEPSPVELVSATASVEPALQTTYAESASVQPVESLEPGPWQSDKRLIVEFQFRQVGEQTEYRVVTSSEGEHSSGWAGLGESKLRRWLIEQIEKRSISTKQPAKLEFNCDLTAPGLEVEPSTSTPELTPNPDLDFILEINQLAIRQNSGLANSIIVDPKGLKQSYKTGYAFLTSQQPFSVEVVLQLSRQPAFNTPTLTTYQAQFHVQNRATGQWIALGQTKPDMLENDRLVYNAHLFDTTLAPGIYRLQVLATLQGAIAGLTSFELPLLNVV